MDRYHTTQWALEREDAASDGMSERVKSKAVLLGIFDWGVVEVGHNSARSGQGVVGARNSVSANGKFVGVDTIMTGVSLRHQSNGCFRQATTQHG
ncbi:hypothetical protein [Rhodobacter sp. SGA-6-6]|uniref:hypothetical protein n=1 Tax=Rhodobacter sp. SGA-6-6 TaxID=2710882 RepID=UPI001F0E2993|nr:hypothetical protein [Rhodobacter sp. SGA-6-6]